LSPLDEYLSPISSSEQRLDQTRLFLVRRLG
jgi:hypothetical protein